MSRSLSVLLLSVLFQHFVTCNEANIRKENVIDSSYIFQENYVHFVNSFWCLGPIKEACHAVVDVPITTWYHLQHWWCSDNHVLTALHSDCLVIVLLDFYVTAIRIIECNAFNTGYKWIDHRLTSNAYEKLFYIFVFRARRRGMLHILKDINTCSLYLNLEVCFFYHVYWTRSQYRTFFANAYLPVLMNILNAIFIVILILTFQMAT